MRKKVFLFVGSLVIFAMLAGCSGNTKEDLETIHNDIKENVADPVFAVSDEIDEKFTEFEEGSVSTEEMNTYFEEDLKDIIEEKREYLADYSEPKSDEAKEYYSVLSDSMYTTFDVFDVATELMVALINEDMEAIISLEDEVEKVTQEADDVMDELDKLQKKYEEELDAEFDDIDHL